MLVGGYERYVTELVLQVDTKGLYSVAHGVARSDTWEVL